MVRAAEFDPGFSGALANVGDWNVLFGDAESPEETLAGAFTAARTAVSLDDKDAMAHWALGRVYTQMAESEAAVAEVAAGLGDAHRVERRAEGALGKKRDRFPLRHRRAPLLCLLLLSNCTTPVRFRKDPGRDCWNTSGSFGL